MLVFCVVLNFAQWYDAFFKDDEIDEIECDDDEISRFFEVRGLLEGSIAVILEFAGLPLSPDTFFPPEQEFEVLRQVQQVNQQNLSQGLLFNPHSEAMLSCLTKGWLHMEDPKRRVQMLLSNPVSQKVSDVLSAQA